MGVGVADGSGGVHSSSLLCVANPAGDGTYAIGFRERDLGGTKLSSEIVSKTGESGLRRSRLG